MTVTIKIKKAIQRSRMIIQNKVKYLLFLLILVHLFSLSLFPFFRGDWEYVQSVWMSWQGVIVGGLASITSYFIYLTTRNNEIIKRRNQLKASRSSLSQALSELLNYCKASKGVYLEVWDRAKVHNERLARRTEIIAKPPMLPTSHEITFHRCIEYEDDEEITNFMIKVLNYLQINHSRMYSFSNPDSSYSDTKESILSMICFLAELTQMINMLFSYARERDEIVRTEIIESDIYTGLNILDIDSGDLGGIEEYLSRRFRNNVG